MAANDKVTYVLIRLDENVEPEEGIREMVDSVKGAEVVQQKSVTLKDEDLFGVPIIYFP